MKKVSIDYSVVIRTTGKAGEKYQALLDSLAKLDPQPKEVIVVLPEGYDLPLEKLGWERFCFSTKGMVIQRAEGMAQCQTGFALVCDDDVSFPSDFVCKLYEPILEGEAVFSSAPLYSFLPDNGREKWICSIMLSAVPMVLHKKERYISILRSTGYSYNKGLDRSVKRYYEAQALPWTCFFADVKAFRAIEIEKEAWLDAHGYAALDDQTMFYKAHLMGLKTVVVSNAFYEHLDAGTSTQGNKPEALYAGKYNKVVFWRRFIYDMQNNVFQRGAARAAFIYRMLWERFRDYVNMFRGRMTKEEYKVCKQGYSDGRKYIQSKEYRDLPPIRWGARSGT